MPIVPIVPAFRFAPLGMSNPNVTSAHLEDIKEHTGVSGVADVTGAPQPQADDVSASAPVLTCDVVKSLFASMNDTLRAQQWAATVSARQERRMRAMRFAVHVLLPCMAELRSRGQWLIKLQSPKVSGCSSSVTTHMVVETEDLANLADLALLLLTEDVLPPGWHFDIADAHHATLRCQPAVGDEVHVHMSAVVAADQTCVVPVTQLHPEDLELLTVAWPWKATALARIDFESGRIDLCTAPNVVSVTPGSATPEAHQFRAQTFLEAALAATRHDVGDIWMRQLESLLAGQPFLVRDRLGHVCPAVALGVTGSTGGLPMRTRISFQFPGFCFTENVVYAMDSINIVAVLPPRPEGLGKFMFAYAHSACAAWNVGSERVCAIVKRDEPTKEQVYILHCRIPEPADEKTVVQRMTPATFAMPVVGKLNSAFLYPLVCGLLPKDLAQLFADVRLYQKVDSQ